VLTYQVCLSLILSFPKLNFDSSRPEHFSNECAIVIQLAIASGAITEQISSGAISAKPNSARTAPSQPAPTKSWERPTLRIPLPTTATKLKFSGDGERLFTNGATEQSAELWSLTTGNRISAFPAKSGFALCDVALSPDGQFAAALMYSREAPTLPTKRKVELKVWNLKTGQSRWTTPIQDHAIQTTETPVCQVKFSPNSRVLATSISSPSNKFQSGVRI